MADIAFIGAGKMAEALVGGIIRSKVFPASRIVMSDVDPVRLEKMERKYGVVAVSDNTAAALRTRCVLFAVKPQNMERALLDVRRARNGTEGEVLYISIAAGVKVSAILSLLGKGCRVFRVMPNLPVLAGEGAVAVCGTGKDGDFETAGKIFGSVGIVEFVPEEQMDAFTALSGGGPAFLARFAESLISAGEKLGIPRETARRFTIQTLFGSAKMMASGGISPQEVREMVSSPGGTTLAGLAEFEKSGFSHTVENALEAAAKRSTELCEAGRTGGKK